MSVVPPIPADLWAKVPPDAQAALLAVLAGYEHRIQTLEARIVTLEQRLATNSSNSSLPPSANPPHAPKPVVKTPTGRKTGGQPGHPGHSRQRLPAERIDHVIPLIPTHCERCRTALPAEATPADPEPTWHQVAELPRVAAVVTEFQGHARTCPCCHHVTRETIPAEITADFSGPRLSAALSYLAGCQHVSQRGLEAVADDLFGVPVSLGSITAMQRDISGALESTHRQIGEEVRAAAYKNVDETSWKLCKCLCWLWVATTDLASYFLVQAHRSRDEMETLLGDKPAGVIGSDRYGVYDELPLDQRQLCWAHLKRDFQAMVDRGGRGRRIGEGLLEEQARAFDLWYAYREGKLSWAEMNRQMLSGPRPRVEEWLIEGGCCGCAKTQRTCMNVLLWEEALWTFARIPGVEPTNNAAERVLRPAVLRRKRSYGSQSEAGCRFVERLLSVIGTVRKRSGRVLDYLCEALKAHRHGLPPPPLPAPS